MKEEQLLAYLKANCVGRGKRQTRAQLQRKLNLSKDQLTNLVHRMRCKALPIAGGPLGYYYAQNAGEILSTIRWLEKMVRTLLESINGLVKAMESFGPMDAGDGNGGGPGGDSPCEASSPGWAAKGSFCGSSTSWPPAATPSSWMCSAAAAPSP